MIFAALFAPVIDRVYLGLRGASQERLREIYRRREVAPSIETDFYFGLLVRPLPADALRAVANHRDVDLPRQGVRQGIVTVEKSGTCALTPFGRELALETQAAVGAAAAELWAEHSARLTRLNAYSRRLLSSGRHSGGPVFRAVSEVYSADDVSAHALLANRLGALRHHRADAYRAAWRSAGVTFEDLTRSHDTELRQRIEADTDRRNTPLFSILSDEERYDLLAGLGALPN